MLHIRPLKGSFIFRDSSLDRIGGNMKKNWKLHFIKDYRRLDIMEMMFVVWVSWRQCRECELTNWCLDKVWTVYKLQTRYDNPRDAGIKIHVQTKGRSTVMRRSSNVMSSCDVFINLRNWKSVHKSSRKLSLWLRKGFRSWSLNPIEEALKVHQRDSHSVTIGMYSTGLALK